MKRFSLIDKINTFFNKKEHVQFEVVDDSEELTSGYVHNVEDIKILEDTSISIGSSVLVNGVGNQSSLGKGKSITFNNVAEVVLIREDDDFPYAVSVNEDLVGWFKADDITKI